MSHANDIFHRTIHICESKGSLPEPASSEQTRGLFHVDQQPRAQPAPGYPDEPAERGVPKHPEFKPALEQPNTDTAQQLPPQLTPTILSSSLLKAEEEWEAFARPIKLSDGSQKWQCCWQTMDDGAEVGCNYVSKKQLVKRHIETTHLKYK